MKKLTKKDYFNLAIILTIIFIYILFLVKDKFVYGSTVDWDAQHFAIPEYFRLLFYKTGNILPSFAFNVGLGQNIYNLSYYGLLSPIILISYLFPFLKMVDYIQISSILSVVISVIIFYKWIGNKYDLKVTFISTIVFAFATPLLFHSHRHIMFINYMPFLIYALLSVDKYFEENKKSSLIVSTFLIIMTSYFYSVSALAVILIYYCFVYFKRNERITFKKSLKSGSVFIFSIIVSLMMSAILIVPTFYTLLSGRSESNITIDILKLFIPNFNISSMFYSAYSFGLGAILLVSIIDNLLFKKKENKFLAIITIMLLIFPVFVYILNGTMYIDTKVLIPFLPLFGLIIAMTLNHVFEKRYDYKKNILVLMTLVILLLILDNSKMKFYLLIDIVLLVTFIVIGRKYEKRVVIISIPIIVSSVLALFTVGINDKLYLKKDMAILENSSNIELVKKMENTEKGIYRLSNQNYILQNINKIYDIDQYQSTIYSSVSNKYYKEFYYSQSGNEITERSYGKVSSVKNIFYNLYVGNKYIISNDLDLIGYNKFEYLNGNRLYVNNSALPIGYVSSKVMNKKEYEKLSFPYNVEALLNYIVVDNNNIASKYETNIIKKDLEYSIDSQKGLEIEKKKNEYHIKSKDGVLNLNVENFADKEILMLKFDMEKEAACSDGDLVITINGVKNVLTCKTWKYHNKNKEFKYVISSNKKIEKLNIKFSTGNYIIKNIDTYSVDYSYLEKIKNDVSEVDLDALKTKGNSVVGTVNVMEAGYLYFSIPYDYGIKIFVDGNKQDVLLLDTAFIGTKISKGEHKIVIEYETPFLKEAKIMSLIGAGILAIIFVLESKKKLAK